MKRTISGPGASDFLTAGGGEDLPGSGARGTAELREESPVTSARNLTRRLYMLIAKMISNTSTARKTQPKMPI